MGGGEGGEEDTRQRGQVCTSGDWEGLSLPHLHMCNVYIDKLGKFVQGDYLNKYGPGRLNPGSKLP